MHIQGLKVHERVKTSCTICDYYNYYGRFTSQISPTEGFHFPIHKFGSKGEERSFHAEWCVKFF